MPNLMINTDTGKIDLHMHSRYSDDGEFSPAALVEMCLNAGIRAMSLTDHNCARGNAEAQAAAKARDILYIPGIEIDCVARGLNFHVLGYDIDFQNPDFAKIEENIVRQNHDVSLERLRKTQLMGLYLEEQEMRERFQDECWTGEMFCEILLEKQEYREHPLLLPYRPGGSRSDNPYVNFYWDYYAQGRPCYVKVAYPPMEAVIETIHRNAGKAVLAHPGVNLKGHEDLLAPVLSLGLDGIEAFSSYHTPAQADFFCREAEKRRLFVTCGSDFHGKTKPSVHLAGHGLS